MGGASMGGEEDSPVPTGRKRPPQHPTSRSGAVKPKKPKPAAQRGLSLEVDLSSPGSIESPSSSSPVALNPTPSTSPAFSVTANSKCSVKCPGEHDEKWRKRNLEVPSKSKKSSNSCSPVDDECVDIGSEDEDSNGKRNPTPSSAVEKRPPGRKQEKEKLKKGGENLYKESLDNMVATRKELAEERKERETTKWSEMKELEERRTLAEERRTEIEERRTVVEERRTTAEERRTLAEERRAAAEERRAIIEERRVVAEDMAKRAENEQRIMFMDPSKLDEKGRAYLSLCMTVCWRLQREPRKDSTWVDLVVSGAMGALVQMVVLMVVIIEWHRSVA